MNAEIALDGAVVDERSGQEVAPERQAELLYLGWCIGNSRGKMTHDAEQLFGGNLPDAEVGQHVVHAEGIEILLHVLQPLVEPCRQVLVLPVVGRYSPVLPLQGEGIGRGAHTAVEVEEGRMEGGLGTASTHADGQVAFQQDTFRACIVGSTLQLQMQMILRETGQVRLGWPRGMTGMPCGVWVKPLLIGLIPLLVVGRVERQPALLHEECLQILALHHVHSLVVAVIQRVQLVLPTMVVGHQLAVA